MEQDSENGQEKGMVNGRHKISLLNKTKKKWKGQGTSSRQGCSGCCRRNGCLRVGALGHPNVSNAVKVHLSNPARFHHHSDHVPEPTPREDPERASATRAPCRNTDHGCFVSSMDEYCYL